MRQGASFWASQNTTGRSLRRAPHLGGLGPIVWRQAINAVRNSGRVILVFFVVAMLTGPVLASAGTTSGVTGMVGLLYFFVAFMMPRSLVCDFRCELWLNRTLQSPADRAMADLYGAASGAGGAVERHSTGDDFQHPDLLRRARSAGADRTGGAYRARQSAASTVLKT